MKIEITLSAEDMEEAIRDFLEKKSISPYYQKVDYTSITCMGEYKIILEDK